MEKTAMTVTHAGFPPFLFPPIMNHVQKRMNGDPKKVKSAKYINLSMKPYAGAGLEIAGQAPGRLDS
jgi:hypothetical protein